MKKIVSIITLIALFTLTAEEVFDNADLKQFQKRSAEDKISAIMQTEDVTLLCIALRD